MDTILRSSLVNVYQEGHHWKGALDMLEATAGCQRHAETSSCHFHVKTAKNVMQTCHGQSHSRLKIGVYLPVTVLSCILCVHMYLFGGHHKELHSKRLIMDLYYPLLRGIYHHRLLRTLLVQPPTACRVLQAPNLVAYCAVMGATSSASRTPRPPHAWRRAVQLYAALQWARVGALSACSTVCGALEAERSARSTSSAELWVELQRRALSVLKRSEKRIWRDKGLDRDRRCMWRA